jgi:hypothetical protein
MSVKFGLSLTEEHGLRVFENRVLRESSGRGRGEEDCIVGSIITCILHGNYY